MNLLDIILIIPLIWMAYRGFTKGFIIELATLVALIVGIYAAINFSWLSGEFLSEHFKIEEKYLSVISFIVTFLVVVLIVVGIGKVIEKIIDLVALGFINKILGAAFGVLKAVVVLSVILLIIETFDSNDRVITEKSRENSMLYGPVSSVIPKLLSIIDLDRLEPAKRKAGEIFALR